MKKEKAEAEALNGLRFLAERPEEFARFMALGGLEPEEIAARASEPELLAALVDFLASDEDLAMGFCQEAGLTPETFAALRAALPGGQNTHWT